MSYNAKNWSNPINLDASNLNRLEQGIKNSHDTLEILNEEVSNLQLRYKNTASNIDLLVKDSPNILETLNSIQATIKNNDINSILSSMDSFLMKSKQTLTDKELSQVYSNLKLNNFLRLKSITVNGENVVEGSMVNIKLPKVDEYLNINSTNAISNRAVAEALNKLTTLKPSESNTNTNTNTNTNISGLADWVLQPNKPQYYFSEIIGKPDLITKTEAHKYTDDIFSALVNEAPEALDTLKEISDWIATDEYGTTALINRVSSIEQNYLPLTGGALTGKLEFTGTHPHITRTDGSDLCISLDGNWDADVGEYVFSSAGFRPSGARSNKQSLTGWLNGQFSGTVFDGSSGKTVKLTNNNPVTYPYHRIAYTQTISSNYYDAHIILLISRGFSGGGFGILDLTFRTNQCIPTSTAESTPPSISGKWLVSSNLTESNVVFNLHYDDSTSNEYGTIYKNIVCDVFYKTPYTYEGVAIKELLSDRRGTAERRWTLVNSYDTSSTNYSECWKTQEEAATSLRGSVAKITGVATLDGEVKTATYATSRTSKPSVLSNDNTIATTNWAVERIDGTAKDSSAFNNTNLKTLIANIQINASEGSNLVTTTNSISGVDPGVYHHLINLGGFKDSNYASQITMPYITSLPYTKMLIRTANGANWRNWAEVITDDPVQTIPQKFIRDLKIGISSSETDQANFRYALATPVAWSTDKRYLMGVAGLNSRYSNAMQNIYAQSNVLYSNVFAYKNSSIDRAATEGPSSDIYNQAFQIRDKNDKTLCAVESGWMKDRKSKINIICYKGTTATDNSNARIEVGWNADGTSYTYCGPTPPSDSNDNQIATTKWVKARTDIFLPRSAGSSYPLSGDLYIPTNNYIRTNGSAVLGYNGSTLNLGNPDISTNLRGKTIDTSTTINTSVKTNTYENARQGINVAINMTGSAGYNMLMKGNSTNGYFVQGVYNNRYMLYYIANTVTTNTYTKEACLLNESGNTTLPGELLLNSSTANRVTFQQSGTAKYDISKNADGSSLYIWDYVRQIAPYTINSGNTYIRTKIDNTTSTTQYTFTFDNTGGFHIPSGGKLYFD